MMIASKIQFKILSPLFPFSLQGKPPKNYYQLLQCSHTADLPQIKRKYFQLAKKLHPDHKVGDQNKFQQLSQAYKILSNAQSRREYDRAQGFGEESKNSGAKNERGEGKGPSEQEREFKQQESAHEAYMRNNDVEWRKTRMGIRPQSYASFYSSHEEQRGPESDEEIRHYKLADVKALKLKNQGDLKQAKQKIKELNKDFIQKHQQRMNEQKQKMEDQRRRRMEKSLAGRSILFIEGLFLNKTGKQFQKGNEFSGRQRGRND